MASENAPEKGKVSDLESKLNHTQRINSDLIKELVLAKKVIGFVFNDRLFIEKAAGYESEELQEFVQQELQKRYAQAAPEAPAPKEEPQTQANAEEQELMKQTIKAIIGPDEYNAAMEVGDLKERYEQVAKSINSRFAVVLKKKSVDIINATTRRFAQDGATKDSEIKKLSEQVEELKKNLADEKARAAEYQQLSANSGQTAEPAAALESLQKEHLELSQAFYTLHDIVADYVAFAKNIELLKDKLLKNMEAKIDE